MSDARYQIHVDGRLVDGARTEEVAQRLARLFNTPADKLAPLFSGRRVVIKKGVDRATAQTYVARVEQAGLRCFAEPASGAAPPSPAEADPVPTAQAAPELATEARTEPGATELAPTAMDSAATRNAPHAEPAPEPVSAAAAPETDSGPELAPAGSVLVEAPVIAPPQIDIAHLRLGSPDQTLAVQVINVPPKIDTSALSVAPPGESLIELPDAPPVDIDTSHLSLAQAGESLEEIKKTAPPPLPDISHLGLK
ncbi:MAG TPA: hypothetical protein ENJ19_05380 [Gammaproteobacteria bacterium]|nr:hypothetical protein [Gammaproteobacteria bacterium]